MVTQIDGRAPVPPPDETMTPPYQMWRAEEAICAQLQSFSPLERVDILLGAFNRYFPGYSYPAFPPDAEHSPSQRPIAMDDTPKERPENEAHLQYVPVGNGLEYAAEPGYLRSAKGAEKLPRTANVILTTLLEANGSPLSARRLRRAITEHHGEPVTDRTFYNSVSILRYSLRMLSDTVVVHHTRHGYALKILTP